MVRGTVTRVKQNVACVLGTPIVHTALTLRWCVLRALWVRKLVCFARLMFLTVLTVFLTVLTVLSHGSHGSHGSISRFSRFSRVYLTVLTVFGLARSCPKLSMFVGVACSIQAPKQISMYTRSPSQTNCRAELTTAPLWQTSQMQAMLLRAWKRDPCLLRVAAPKDCWTSVRAAHWMSGLLYISMRRFSTEPRFASSHMSSKSMSSFCMTGEGVLLAELR